MEWKTASNAYSTLLRTNLAESFKEAWHSIYGEMPSIDSIRSSEQYKPQLPNNLMYDRLDSTSEATAIAHFLRHVQHPLDNSALDWLLDSRCQARWSIDRATRRLRLTCALLQSETESHNVSSVLCKQFSPCVPKPTQLVDLLTSVRCREYTLNMEENNPFVIRHVTRSACAPATNGAHACFRDAVACLGRWSFGGVHLGKDIIDMIVGHIPVWDQVVMLTMSADTKSVCSGASAYELTGMLCETYCNSNCTTWSVQEYLKQQKHVLEHYIKCMTRLAMDVARRRNSCSRKRSFAGEPKCRSAGRTAVVCDEETAVRIRQKMRCFGTSLAMRSVVPQIYKNDFASMADVLFIRPYMYQATCGDQLKSMLVDRIVLCSPNVRGVNGIPTWRPTALQRLTWQHAFQMSGQMEYEGIAQIPFKSFYKRPENL